MVLCGFKIQRFISVDKKRHLVRHPPLITSNCFYLLCPHGLPHSDRLEDKSSTCCLFKSHVLHKDTRQEGTESKVKAASTIPRLVYHGDANKSSAPPQTSSNTTSG